MALAAIQGVNRKLADERTLREVELALKQDEIDGLRERLVALERRLLALEGGAD